MNSSGNWGQTICIAEKLKQAPSMGIRKLFGCHFLGVLNQCVQQISRTLNVSNKIVYSFSLRRIRMLTILLGKALLLSLSLQGIINLHVPFQAGFFYQTAFRSSFSPCVLPHLSHPSLYFFFLFQHIILFPMYFCLLVSLEFRLLQSIEELGI